MRAHEIEAWVLRITDRIRSRQPVEDFRVELKSEWPADTAKAARRLAGHCNAARGEPVLWIIGIDQTTGVVGADHAELPAWRDQVRTHFASMMPDLLRDLNIHIEDKTVVALLFETDRAPFLVKNPTHGEAGGGPIESEVPWRDGTSVRTARREDLLRLLVPIQRLPEVELVDAALTCSQQEWRNPRRQRHVWELTLALYVVAATRDRTILPVHRCQAGFTLAASTPPLESPCILLRPLMQDPDPWAPISMKEGYSISRDHGIESRTVDYSPTEAIVDGAGLVVLVYTANSDLADSSVFLADAAFSASIGVAGTDRSIPLKGHFSAPPREPQEGETVAWGWRS